jgi:hypothetical protein
MMPLMAGDNQGFLTRDEELQFKGMINRLHNLFKVQYTSGLVISGRCEIILKLYILFSMPRSRMCG